MGDDLLRVIVTEPARAGLANDVRDLLPNAIDIRLQRSDDARPSRSSSAAAGARTSCSRRTWPNRSIADERLEQLFATLASRGRRGARHEAHPTRDLGLRGLPGPDDHRLHRRRLLRPGRARRARESPRSSTPSASPSTDRCPATRTRRLIRYVVTLGASEAKVSLTFELEGLTYVATRVVRRQPRAGCPPRKRASSASSQTIRATCSLAENARWTTPSKICLRLDFDDFTRCVVLPQGEFAQFLRAKGDERRALLIKLLNLAVYLEVGSRAGRRAEAAMAEATLRRQSLERSAFATEDALKVAKKRVGCDRQADEGGGEGPSQDRRRAAARRGADTPREGGARRSSPSSRRLLCPTRHASTAPPCATPRGAGGSTGGREQGPRRPARPPKQDTKDLPDLGELQGALEAHGGLTICVANLEAARETATQAAAAEQTASQSLAAAQAAHEAAVAELKVLRPPTWPTTWPSRWSSANRVRSASTSSRLGRPSTPQRPWRRPRRPRRTQRVRWRRLAAVLDDSGPADQRGQREDHGPRGRARRSRGQGQGASRRREAGREPSRKPKQSTTPSPQHARPRTRPRTP